METVLSDIRLSLQCREADSGRWSGVGVVCSKAVILLSYFFTVSL